MKNKFSLGPSGVALLANHLRFAIRVFLRDKFFSSLNILGLTLGIAVSIVLLQSLRSDLTYDQHYPHHERIYRIGCHQVQTGLDFRYARSARDLGTVIGEELPEIQAVARLGDWLGRQLVIHEQGGEKRKFYEEGILETDSSYFKVFGHTFIYGNAETCLHSPEGVVITRNIASKYFGEVDPTGESLTIDGRLWTVTAVIENLPDNTHLKFDFLLSNRRWMDGSKIESENFWNPGHYLYILGPEGYRPEDFYSKFPALYDKYYKPFAPQVGGKYTPIVESLASIHFQSDLDADEPHGSLYYLYGFTLTGILVVLLACINYMNLSTAKSMTRSTEIAVKKLVGSSRRFLMMSFLLESILLALVSFVIAMGLVYFLMDTPTFSQIIGRTLSFDWLHDPTLLLGALGLTVLIGIVSGLYPALFLPAMPLVKALKKQFSNASSGQLFRRILITTQFSISIFVVFCTFFIRDQIEFVRNRPLGFDKENILLVPMRDSSISNHLEAIKKDLLENPDIQSVSTAENVVGANVGGVRNFWVSTESGPKQVGFITLFVGDDFIETMGLELVEGTDFKKGPVMEKEMPYIINEAAAQMMGGIDEAVGNEMKFFQGDLQGHVVGVVRDFNFRSLHNTIEPLLIIKPGWESGYLYLKVSSAALPKTISFVNKTWDRYNAVDPFEYFFLNERFNDQYKSDERQYSMFSLLAYICIFISLLGLLGLSAFTATRRTREIGMRRVLGASIGDVLLLLSRNPLSLVLVSAVMVAPLSVWVITRWMDTFAYRQELNFQRLIVITLAAASVVALTVIFQSIKVVRTNPVDSLKHE